jgi:hypothetical protein
LISRCFPATGNAIPSWCSRCILRSGVDGFSFTLMTIAIEAAALPPTIPQPALKTSLGADSNPNAGGGFAAIYASQVSNPTAQAGSGGVQPSGAGKVSSDTGTARPADSRNPEKKTSLPLSAATANFIVQSIVPTPIPQEPLAPSSGMPGATGADASLSPASPAQISESQDATAGSVISTIPATTIQKPEITLASESSLQNSRANVQPVPAASASTGKTDLASSGFANAPRVVKDPQVAEEAKSPAKVQSQPASELTAAPESAQALNLSHARMPVGPIQGFEIAVLPNSGSPTSNANSDPVRDLTFNASSPDENANPADSTPPFLDGTLNTANQVSQLVGFNPAAGLVSADFQSKTLAAEVSVVASPVPKMQQPSLGPDIEHASTQSTSQSLSKAGQVDPTANSFTVDAFSTAVQRVVVNVPTTYAWQLHGNLPFSNSAASHSAPGASASAPGSFSASDRPASASVGAQPISSSQSNERSAPARGSAPVSPANSILAATGNKSTPSSKADSETQSSSPSNSPSGPLAPAATAVAPASVPAVDPGAQPASGQGSVANSTNPKSEAGTPRGTAELAMNAAAPSELSRASALGPVQMAQMLNKAAQSEMRIGLNTSAFGSVEVRTLVHASDVGVLIGSERGDLRSLLANELPAIVHSLQQQNLRLNQVSFEQGFGFSSQTDSRSNPQPRSFTLNSAGATTSSLEFAAAESAEPPDLSNAGGRAGISILA